jgi:predicted tellurium resistance membrane protein TerC
VRVFLNGAYWGVYINVEQPNKDMMKSWMRSNDGNRYRGYPPVGGFQNGRCALTNLGANVQSYRDAYDAKQGDATDLMAMIQTLDNTPQNQLRAVLPAVFNVDSFYRYAAVMNVVTQTDSYIGTGKDHFMFVDEIHGKLEGADDETGAGQAAASLVTVVAQIMVIDVVFSLDSVITAVGMVSELWIMIAANVVALAIMLAAATPISDFVDRHPTIKMLALSFLVLIGTNLVAEGLGHHIPKGYTYFAMFFSFLVEMLNLRLRAHQTAVRLHGTPRTDT